MGQHKNQTQIEIFIAFMELHPDLAKGFVHGDKVHFEQLWVELANELNASGPPTKPMQAWKKVWIDMKLNVKQRLGHNRVETSKTGGGRFNKYILSPYDEQIAAICGLYVSVDGVEGTKKYGIPQKKTKLSTVLINADAVVKPAALTPTPTSMPPLIMPENAEPSAVLINTDVKLKPATSTSTPKSPILMPQNGNIDISQMNDSGLRSPSPTTSRTCNRKRKLRAMDVADVIEMESEQFSKISANIGKLQEEMKENKSYFKDISKNIRELKRLKEKELQETKRHNYEVEKRLKTKNELKLKLLELERLKLGLTTP